MDSFTESYATTALWSSLDDEEPLDRNHDLGDLAPSTVAAFERDCNDFRDQCLAVVLPVAMGKYLDEQGAHDFWLTRNRHGAGFWDGDYSEPWASKLTEVAHRFPEVDLYVGDDGLIYQYGAE